MPTKMGTAMSLRHSILVACIGLNLSACVDTSAVRMGGNLARIDVSAAPVYGGQGATNLALKAAAQETVKAGFTHFTVVDFSGRYDARLVGVMPGMATISGTSGNLYGSARGPTPIIRARNERAMVIRMMNAGDPGSAGAYEANALLAKR